MMAVMMMMAMMMMMMAMTMTMVMVMMMMMIWAQPWHSSRLAHAWTRVRLGEHACFTRSAHVVRTCGQDIRVEIL